MPFFFQGDMNPVVQGDPIFGSLGNAKKLISISPFRKNHDLLPTAPLLKKPQL
jgi:hypothetical protein